MTLDAVDEVAEAYNILDDTETSIRRIVNELKGNKLITELIGSGFMDDLADMGDEIHENLIALGDDMDESAKAEERDMVRGWERDR